MRRRLALGALATAALLAGWVAHRPPVVEVPGDAPSIRRALAEAPIGAVIRLAAGRYPETLLVSRPVTIEGPPDGSAVIEGDAGAPVVTLVGTRDVTLRHLTISGGEVGVLVKGSDGIVISDNAITDNGLRGVWLVHGSAEIVRNVVRNTTSPYGKGIHVANAMSRPRSIIQGNLVEASGADGILTNFARTVIRGNNVRNNDGYGINVSEMSVADVTDNTVTGSGRPGIFVVDMSTALVEGNRVAGESHGVHLEFHSQAWVTGNRIAATSGCPVVTGVGSVVLLRANRVAGKDCPPPAPWARQVAGPPRQGLWVIGLTGAMLLGLPLLAGGRDRWPVLMVATAAAVQVVHQLEHVVQVVQAKLLHWDEAHGLAGAVLDNEWIHLGFNSVLMIALLAAAFGLGRSGLRRWRRRRPHGLAAFAGVLVMQGYHQVEHLVKVSQLLSLGIAPAPGIAGRAFDLVWLHFSINLAVTALLVVALLSLRLLTHPRSSLARAHL
ncbi:MAG: right-handed parallel beta-helix repeat-containing protein, partial [Actinomycetota bacterium]|nr:right-handed parallel beta-helix repeat-containing protein [Actinomycetota bacterium]